MSRNNHKDTPVSTAHDHKSEDEQAKLHLSSALRSIQDYESVVARFLRHPFEPVPKGSRLCSLCSLPDSCGFPSRPGVSRLRSCVLAPHGRSNVRLRPRSRRFCLQERSLFSSGLIFFRMPSIRSPACTEILPALVLSASTRVLARSLNFRCKAPCTTRYPSTSDFRRL